MASIVKIYTSAIKDNFRPLFANWEPGGRVELGDYGFLEDNVFVYQGNVKDIGIKFKIRKDDTGDRKSFASQGTTQTNLSAGASGDVNSVAKVNAEMEIKFSSEKAVFFNALDCKTDMIRDKAKLGEKLLELYKENKWKRSYVVVTDVVHSGATTIVISGSNDASICFQADTEVKELDLADANLKFHISSQKNIGYKVVGESGLVPLIGFSKIQNKFLWWGKEFNTFSTKSMSPSFIDKVEDKENDPEKVEMEDLYFGQMK